MGLLLSETHPDIKRKYSLIRLASVSIFLNRITFRYLIRNIFFEQSWARFVLQQLSTETSNNLRRQKSQDTPDDDSKTPEQVSTDATSNETISNAENLPVESPITELFGAEQELTSRCTKCNNGSGKTSHILLSSLMLNELEGGIIALLLDVRLTGYFAGKMSFEEILERSFDVASSTPAWCDTCQKYQTTQQRRRFTTLPPLLAVSCSNEKESGFRFWANQLFVSET